MTTVYWNDVNPADYAVGSKHTVGDQTLIVAGHGPAGVVLTENGEMPAVGENKFLPPEDKAHFETAWSQPVEVPPAEPGATE